MTAPPGFPDAAAVATAAYGLALRVTGDEEKAVASVEAAAAGGVRASDPVLFVRAVRQEARLRRSAGPPAPIGARPLRLSRIPIGDWAVLERVALRGLSITEAAEALGIDRREALLRLNRGLVEARGCLLGDRQPGDDADAARRDLLDADRAAHGLDDAAGDRQSQTAAAPGVAAGAAAVEAIEDTRRLGR
jgi:hypothetical protein